MFSVPKKWIPSSPALIVNIDPLHQKGCHMVVTHSTLLPFSFDTVGSVSVCQAYACLTVIYLSRVHYCHTTTITTTIWLTVSRGTLSLSSGAVVATLAAATSTVGNWIADVPLIVLWYNHTSHNTHNRTDNLWWKPRDRARRTKLTQYITSSKALVGGREVKSFTQKCCRVKRFTDFWASFYCWSGPCSWCWWWSGCNGCWCSWTSTRSASLSTRET